jgi:hypothetical protein
MMRSLIAASLLGLLTSAAHAVGSSVPYGIGGYFTRYDPIVARFNRSGELFRIEGRCQSACTLFLGIQNVCIERSASLGFHGGHGGKGEISVSSTRHMRGAYNERLRHYLDEHHGMEKRQYFNVSGQDLIEKFGYRECPKK